MLHREYYQGVGEDTDDNGGHAVEQVCGIAHDESDRAPTKLGQVDSAKKSYGHADQRSQSEELSAADNRIGHATTGFAYWSRQFGKEIPVNRGSAMVDEIAEDKEKDGYGDKSTDTGHAEHEAAYKLAPAQPSAHACPTPLPFWEVTIIRMRARPLRIKVSKKRTRPNSISDCR